MKSLVSRAWQVAVNFKPVELVDRGLYPPVCMVCGQPGRLGLDCCSGCEQALPRLRARCASCGLELARPAALCGRCLSRPPAFDATWPGFVYTGPVERLIGRFKFHSDLAAGRVLASLLARRLVEQGAPRPDLIVPVPLHYRRRLQRGFNQSDFLAADLSRQFAGLPWARVLTRRRSTRTQSALPANRRRGNVRHAFGLNRLPVGTRFVALVDDVMTTGSTLNECARILKRGGVERVDVWVVARA